MKKLPFAVLIVLLVVGLALIVAMALLFSHDARRPAWIPSHSILCQDGVDEVYDCGAFLRGQRNNLGGGSRFWDVKTGAFFDCPVVGPDSQSPDCKAAFASGMKCAKRFDCANATPVENGTDESGFTLCTEQSRQGDICTMDYTPVCGRIGLNMGDTLFETFGNACGACHAMKVEGYTQGECPAAMLGRSFKSTDPGVCMRIKFACLEGQEYFGDETGCGCEPAANVSLERTACTDPRPKACTKIYDPVCAEKDNGIRCIKAPCPSTDMVTYASGCTACSDPKVYSYVPGACADAVAPKLAAPMAICDNEEHRASAENIGYRCTVSCPSGYDSYGTQIGLSVCIDHYAKEAMLSWSACAKSTDCPSETQCAYALIDTTHAPINWTGSALDANGEPKDALRCVPQPYANLLVQYSGIKSVDADGKASVAIA